jgi:hypothetical protein
VETQGLFVLKAAPPALVKGKSTCAGILDGRHGRDPKSVERFSVKRS